MPRAEDSSVVHHDVGGCGDTAGRMAVPKIVHRQLEIYGGLNRHFLSRVCDKGVWFVGINNTTTRALHEGTQTVDVGFAKAAQSFKVVQGVTVLATSLVKVRRTYI